jgi:hypothetical protein
VDAATVRALARHVREQAQACQGLGSPFYGVLLDRVAADVAAGGPALAVLAARPENPGNAALALRLAGGVHALVLDGVVPELAAHFPSTGGDGDATAAWPVLRQVLAEHRDTLVAGLDSPPQTNEVGRSAALLAGLLHVPEAATMPVRLVELGASAGLNLRADRYAHQRADGGWWGPADALVRIGGAWQLPVPDVVPDVVERTGCDLRPLDPLDPLARRRLESYVWPDQRERLERLRAALEEAARTPATVHRLGAAEMLAGTEPAEGVLTVVWHSVVWQYLPASEQASAGAEIDRLLAAATPTAPVAHVAVEPGPPAPRRPLRFPVTVRRGAGEGEQAAVARVVAEAAAHGPPVTAP